ncbi:MAG: hypothetical protein Q9214_002330 [Letrouitia sp. 1 TL-2023]
MAEARSVRLGRQSVADSRGQNSRTILEPNQRAEPRDGPLEMQEILQRTPSCQICKSDSLDDFPFDKRLAQMSEELNKQNSQIKQLKSTLEKSKNTGDKEPVLALQEEIETVADVFSDCISNASDDGFVTPVEQFERAGSGSPRPFFESSPFFYPEQYTSVTHLSTRLFVHAMVQSQKDERTQKLFITYQQAGRVWRRVIAYATFQSRKLRHSLFQDSIYDNHEFVAKSLPENMSDILDSLLLDAELFSSITGLYLPLTQNESGELVAEPNGVKIVEDDSEVALCREEQIIQDIENMCCTVFLEGEVVVRYRVSTSRFVVFVDSKTCMERKASFPSAAQQDINSFQEFYNDLKLLHSLQGCQSILQFIGVVLDNTRQHVRGYLHEYPDYNIHQVFDSAASRSSVVPWKIREAWAWQIITAVCELHRKGVVVGLEQLWMISVRSDGSIALSVASQRCRSNRHGYCAPELRESRTTKKEPSLKEENFRTDIFTLGLILWQLAEHRASLWGYFCAKNDCTQVPRYACDAPHTNPIKLPNCCTGIPRYFSDMIQKCRAWDPKARPSARQLLDMFPDELKAGILPEGIEKIAKRFPRTHIGAPVWCNECGALTTEDHYHCNICDGGDFDLCSTCIRQEIRCYNPEHQLVRRRLKGGLFVELGY